MMENPGPCSDDLTGEGGLAFVELLRNEIVRLEVELTDLVGRRSAVIAPLDQRIADTERRIAAAVLMLATYTEADTEQVRRWMPTPPAPPAEPTWAVNVASAAIPTDSKGQPRRQNSKRAKIIRATTAFLQENGAASRSEIIKFLCHLGIMGHERNPKAYLSVILSRSKEIFATNGIVWRLKDSQQHSRRKAVMHGRAGRH
jgi:hypothetical protein